jgi:hypothetical protein
MAGGLKTASFTVRATMAQSARWKQAAEGEGFSSVGSWLSGAADAYLKVRARAGLPVPLAWRQGTFRTRFIDGREAEVRGKISAPFGIYWGTEAELIHKELYTLVYVPALRPVATLRTVRHCKALASELARAWVRLDGSEPAQDPAPLLQRFQRENV